MDVGGRPGLVMELLSRENWLYRSAEKITKDNPGRLKNICEQYFEVLTTAHALGLNVGDKKGDDLYYIPEQERLVVLDWNVVTDTELNEARAKGNILQGFKFFTEGLAQYWSPETLEKIKALERRVDYMSRVPSAAEVLDVIRNIDAVSLEQLTTRAVGSKDILFQP